MNEKREEEKNELVAKRARGGVTLRASDKTLLFDVLQWPLNLKKRGRVRPISILVHPSRVLTRGYILFSSSVCFWINSYHLPANAYIEMRRLLENNVWGSTSQTSQRQLLVSKKSGINDRKSIFPLINKWPAFDIRLPSCCSLMEVRR